MDRINLLQYTKLKDTSNYDAVLKHLKPKNRFAGGTIDFEKLSYKEVRFCLALLNDISSDRKLKDWKKLEELFITAYSVNHAGFWNADIDEYYSAVNYLVKTFSELLKKESNLLSSISSDAGIWEQAGGSKLDKFSNVMPLVQLGEIYNIYPYDLQDKPYNEILLLLFLHKEKSEINAEYSRLKSK